MRHSVGSSRRSFPASLRFLAKAAAAGCVSLALLVPADAQFWGPWNSRPQPRQQQQQQGYSPFGGFFSPYPSPSQPQENRQQREIDYSRAPSPTRKLDASVTTPIVVMGDAMADWLGYGLEDAFSEKPEIGIIRKNRAKLRTHSLRATTRHRVGAGRARDHCGGKPKFIVFMIGVNDRQSIRERAPTVAAVPLGKPGAAKPAPQAAPTPAEPSEAPPQAAEQDRADNPEQPAASEKGKSAGATGTFEFHTEKWEAAYVKRIDATIAALKSAGVPVFWVGLPAQRAARASSDSAYLNDLYRSRAEKAGITYVDVWDGFVDESGRFAAQGPDFEGQIRRLRTGDGVYFTKAGARKLAHYAEREITRNLSNQAVPVALPQTIEPLPLTLDGKPSGPRHVRSSALQSHLPWRHPRPRTSSAADAKPNGRARSDRRARAHQGRAGRRADRTR